MGLLMDRPVQAKVNTILLPLESYLWLHNECFKQRNERLMDGISDSQRERLTRNWQQHQYNGYYHAYDGSFGGCKGNPLHGWEEGRWTSWSCAEMARMLDKQGLPYKMGDPTDVIYT